MYLIRTQYKESFQVRNFCQTHRRRGETYNVQVRVVKNRGHVLPGTPPGDHKSKLYALLTIQLLYLQNPFFTSLISGTRSTSTHYMLDCVTSDHNINENTKKIESKMSARQMISSLVATTRWQVSKPQNLRASGQSRQFFGGRNWDPFSDLNTALKEIERNSKELEKQFQRVGKNLGLPPFTTRSIPIQGIFLLISFCAV